MRDPDSRVSIGSTVVAIAALLSVVILGGVWLNRSRPAQTNNSTLVPHTVPAPPALLSPESLITTNSPPSPVTATSSVSSSVSSSLSSPSGSSSSTSPSSNSSSSNSSLLEDMISAAIPAVVLVETSTGRGSAFFISRDTLITNVHVVGSNGSVTIQRVNGARESALVADLSREFDIAVLKVSEPDPNQATIALGSAASLRVGQEVIAIGSALGTLQNTVTRGIVSAVRQSGTATLVQTDAAVNPGNSGGPLLDRKGAAIGITTMGYTNSQGLNFAVAIDHARDLLEGRLTQLGSAPNASVGLTSLSPAVPSETDRVRDEGARAYEQTLAELARRADALDDYWNRFRATCYRRGGVTGVFDREWLATLDDRAMRDPVAPDCLNWVGDIKRQAIDIKTKAIEAEEAARKAGVFPGVRRDALQKYRLQVQ
jgi:S1-C subfamily serine protease